MRGSLALDNSLLFSPFLSLLVKKAPPAPKKCRSQWVFLLLRVLCPMSYEWTSFYWYWLSVYRTMDFLFSIDWLFLVMSTRCTYPLWRPAGGTHHHHPPSGNICVAESASRLHRGTHIFMIEYNFDNSTTASNMIFNDVIYMPWAIIFFKISKKMDKLYRSVSKSISEITFFLCMKTHTL